VNFRKGTKSTLVVNDFLPKNNHHPLLGFYVFQSRRKYFLILVVLVVSSSLIVSGLTWAIVSATPVKITSVLPNESNNQPTPAPTLPTIGSASGQIALIELELRAEIRKTSGLTFWAGPMLRGKYTITNTEVGINLVRYLPKGLGLADPVFTYRVIATYKLDNAYNLLVAAGESESAVIIINQDGTVVYYEKARPKNVFMAFKGVDYQVEIFDPTPGVALKLASTPGAIVPLF